MQDDPAGNRITRFLEEYECLKRLKGEPCRMNGADLLKIIKTHDFEGMLHTVRNFHENRKQHAQVESGMLSASTVTDFFGSFLPDVKKAFQIPFIWLTVIEGTPIGDFLETVSPEKRCSVDGSVAFIAKAAFDSYFKNGPCPLIAGAYMGPYARFFPEKHTFPIRSMAIVPLHIDGGIAGSINFGHFVSNRFMPGMDTGWIEQIMIKASLCLSKVFAHEKIRYLDQYDSISGLRNRNSLVAELEREFSRSARYHNDLSVVSLDLDGFKGLNARYGHDYGDMAVRYVARRMQGLSRAQDVTARFSAEEFVLLLPGSNRESAEILVRRLQDDMDANPFDYGGIKFHLALNSGIASIREDTFDTPEALLRTAYKRLNDSRWKRENRRQLAGGSNLYRIRASG